MKRAEITNIISDTTGYRVLEFKPQFTNNMLASLVIGQPDFTSRNSSPTQNGLGYPTGLTFDKSGNLWVADENNNRVME
jgi:secreted PhoX family phosphatase